MARRIPKEPVAAEKKMDAVEKREEEDDAELDDAEAAFPDMEEEFHTEDSEADDDGQELASIVDDEQKALIAPEGPEDDSEEDDESDEDEDQPSADQTAPPYLPAHLLRPASPVRTTSEAVSIPFSDLTRKQKQGQRRSSRQQKKRQYERIKGHAKASGVVLPAGRAAQVKRGVLPTSDRVTSGRVAKKAAVKESSKLGGRQRLVEDRKRKLGIAVQESGERDGKPSKKARRAANRAARAAAG